MLWKKEHGLPLLCFASRIESCILAVTSQHTLLSTCSSSSKGGKETHIMAHSSITDNDRLVLDTSVNEVPEALQVPTKAVSPGFQLLLSLANTAIWLSILPIGQILLPMQIAALNTATRFSNLAIATSVGVLAALLTNPIAGALSDRTTSRLGRRRPWLTAGTIFSAVALVLMANSASFITLVIWWA